jgi:dTDP-4-amino-4,6-dideoxygalactose transaminase
VRLGRPAIERDDLRSVAVVLASGQLVQGPVVEAFEEKFAGMLGAPHAVAVSSGTAALHLTLKAVGVGRGDEVIVPAFTFPATANVVEWLGARPVFCDIEPRGFNAGPEQFACAVSARTRAVMPVHLFGAVADIPAIARAVKRAARGRRRPVVVEDAACALGASLRGEPAGMLGTAGCFSFHPRKVLTTGEGGMVVTRGAVLARRLRALRSHGIDRAPVFREPGLNCRMTDFQAALGLGQLGRLDALLARRARLTAAYREAFASLACVEMPPPLPAAVDAPQSFVVLFRTRALRDRAAAALRRAGVEATFGTYCVPMLGWYRRRYRLHRRMFPNAWGAYTRTLALPLHPALTSREQRRVIRRLREAFA